MEHTLSRRSTVAHFTVALLPQSRYMWYTAAERSPSGRPSGAAGESSQCTCPAHWEASGEVEHDNTEIQCGIQIIGVGILLLHQIDAVILHKEAIGLTVEIAGESEAA